MLPRVRPFLSLLLALTFGATSAAPGLFHGCAAGREMAAAVLQQGDAAQAPMDCEHHHDAPHQHSGSSGCNCVGHACCTVAVALAAPPAGFAIAGTRAPVAVILAFSEAPSIGLRHRQPPALAPPTHLA